MKLHYSQTPTSAIKKLTKVLLPYEITLFSNYNMQVIKRDGVLLPYEITLFSNDCGFAIRIQIVLLPYEITLFSNLK